MRIDYKIGIILLVTVTIFSCVPQKKLQEEQAKRESCEKELTALKATDQDCQSKNADMKEQLTENAKAIKGLQSDTAILGNSYREITQKYDKLNEINEELLSKYNQLLAGNLSDTKQLSGQLQNTQDELLKKQDQLNAEKHNLDSLTVELQKREARVNQLELILKQKDQAVQDLKKKVSDALLGFENKGLTVTEKNGKIYVSLDESLLFASGSTQVEAKGVDALQTLAKVLAQNPDISIMVEGNTDNVPMKGRGDIKDNWDLSVMRATSVVKILLKNQDVNPAHLTAAGCGEYNPVDSNSTSEGRAKNRRTDIILTPKLDSLFKVLDEN
ncbi:MAG TPA: OmpA family protein [Bacteroidia bacterium]|nr:OmpA family protein [Bacteroidia bacterium]